MKKKKRNKVMRAGPLIFWLTLFPGVGNTQAASFDCNKATTKVEMMICADAELSKLDEELNNKYVDVLSKNTSPDTIKAKQKEWLKERNRCGNVACVKSAYISRIEGVNSIDESKAPFAQAKPVIKSTPKPKQDADETCLKPKIDWRNYEWTLIVGNGRTACEEMLTYLESRPKDGPPPVCQEDRLPPNGHWTRPEWKEVSEAQRQHFLESIPEKKQKFFKPYLERYKLMTAHTDISGDGVSENLMAIVYSGGDQLCRKSTRCAESEGEYQGYVNLKGSLWYDL